MLQASLPGRLGSSPGPARPEITTTSRDNGFTLIELMIVIGLIGLLIGILLPALAASRDRARVVTCGTNQRSISQGLVSYAANNKNNLPAGPNTPCDLFGTLGGNWGGKTWGQIMTNQIWVGDPTLTPSVALPGSQFANGLGPLLLDDFLFDAKAFYCPGDESNNPFVELDKWNKKTLVPNVDIYSSFYYRQKMNMSNTRLDDMGVNMKNKVATALTFDCNNVSATPSFNRANHLGKTMNIMFSDGHVSVYSTAVNPYFTMLLSDQPTGPFDFTVATIPKLNEMLVRADWFGQGQDPSTAPWP
jgi:prepilin-type N-terminal cleavage/methylation domain-containing protein/prepilin-type processing-associated H-X9-DG protein